MFTEVFGNSPRVKLLDFLADHTEFDYTVSQLEELAEISRPTIYKLIEELVADGFIVPTREVGTSHFFRLNTGNPKMVAMLQADFERINKELAASNFGESGAKTRRITRSQKKKSNERSLRGTRTPSVAIEATAGSVIRRGYR